MKASAQFETEEQRQTYFAALHLFAPWSNALVEAANTLNGLGVPPSPATFPRCSILAAGSNRTPALSGSTSLSGSEAAGILGHDKSFGPRSGLPS